MNPKVDRFLKSSNRWQQEMQQLRQISLSCGLTEELKWGKPCYTFQDSNLVIIIPLKEHCALMFCKGALLKDAKGILRKPGENSQSGRWIKFSTVAEIVGMKSNLKAYINEAIAAEKAGLAVTYKKTSAFKFPEELKNKMAHMPALKAAFGALTPGRQRGYLLYFSAAKQAKTRESRIEKCLQRILDGQGLHDR